MNLAQLKSDFHKLIDSISDQQLLVKFYDLMNYSMSKTDERSWDNLSNEQREHILKSYEESEDPANLVAHEDVMKQYGKWLGK